MSKINNTKPHTAFRTLAGLHKALWLGAFGRCSIPSSLMVRGACAVRVKVKKNLFQLAKLGNKTYQSQFYPASCMIASTLHLHTTMTTLEVETNCRGILIATLQPIQEDGDALTIAGHIVPKDKSTGKVFFNFSFTDDENYECELLPNKGLLSHKKLFESFDIHLCIIIKRTSIFHRFSLLSLKSSNLQIKTCAFMSQLTNLANICFGTRFG